MLITKFKSRNHRYRVPIICALSILLSIVVDKSEYAVYGQEMKVPAVLDPELAIKPVVKAFTLHHPTSITFIGPNDILVLAKQTNSEKGHVFRIINGTFLEEPLTEMNVATSSTHNEWCLCGIVASKENNGRTYVYIYFTESTRGQGILDAHGDVVHLANRVYRYELIGNGLFNRILLLDLPVLPGTIHNGGALALGPDENIYLTVGDLNGTFTNNSLYETTAQNYIEGKDPDGRAAILRVTKEGGSVEDSPLGEDFPLNLYYAYGIRNSFGIDFDPLTGILWDTENGPSFGDEINLVRPGFNSGWYKVQGVWEVIDVRGSNVTFPHYLGSQGNISHNPHLSEFEGRGRYSEPELTWEVARGLTAIIFFNSSRYGEEYKNSLFIGDIHNGNIYRLTLNSNRTGLELDGNLTDKIVQGDSVRGEDRDLIFAQVKPFGVTDLEVGPDGLLYVVSYNEGTIYRISPYNDHVNVTRDKNITTTIENSTILYSGNDSTIAIQKGLDNLLPGQRLEIGEGTYSMTKPLSVPSDSIVVGQGNETILDFSATKDKDSIRLLDGSVLSNLTVRNIDDYPSTHFSNGTGSLTPNLSSDTASYFLNGARAAMSDYAQAMPTKWM